MRKILLSTVLVLVMVAVVLPYTTGIIAERRIDALVTEINTKNPNINIVVKDYQKGWYQSQAMLDITLTSHDPRLTQFTQGVASSVHFITKEIIHHGPIIASHGFKLGIAYMRNKGLELPDDAHAIINQIFKDQQKPQLSVGLLITLTGRYASDVMLAPFEFKNTQTNTVVDFKGLTSESEISRDFKKIIGHFTLDGFTITSPIVQVTQEKVDIMLNKKENRAGVPYGYFSVDFPGLSVNMTGHPPFSIKGFQFLSNSTIGGSRYNVTFKVNLTKLEYQHQIYGPGKLQTKLSNLNVGTMGDIIRQTEEVATLPTPQAQGQMLMLTVAPLLPKLLNYGPKYDIQYLQLTTPEGAVNAKGFISMQPMGDNPPSLLTVMNAIELQFKGSAPIALVKKVMTNAHQMRIQQMQGRTNAHLPPIPNNNTNLAENLTSDQLAQWESMGFIVREGSDYTVDISYKKRNLQVNGKQIRF